MTGGNVMKTEKCLLKKKSKNELLNIIFRKDDVERNMLKRIKTLKELLVLRESETSTRKIREKLQEILNHAVNEERPNLPVEIEYLKLDGNIVTRNLRNVCFSKELGKDYIEAECSEAYDKVLTFAIDRIIHIKPLWAKIKSKDDVAEITGIYSFACYGDNHIEYETYFLHKGEKLWKFFEEEYEHVQGCFTIEPFAYHALQTIR